MKIKFVCPNCGSERITIDATVAWDFVKQEWDLQSMHGQGWCSETVSTVEGSEGEQVAYDSEDDEAGHQRTCGLFKYADEIEVPDLVHAIEKARKEHGDE